MSLNKDQSVPFDVSEEALEALRASEERLHVSLEAAGLGHWDFDFASGKLVWSAQIRKLLGVESGAPASRALLLSLVHDEDRPRFEEHLARSSRPDTDHGRRLEFRIVMEGGSVRWLEDQSRVETNAAGTPVRAVGIVRDITARKRAEETQAHLAAIVTPSADAIIGKTLDGIVTSWNDAAERMFGYSAGEMFGQSIRCLIPADRQAEEDMILARLARSESIVHFETTRLAKGARTFDVSVTISPVRDAEGRIIGASNIIRDITDRKRTETQLAEREAQLAMFVEHAPAVVAMFDDKMRYLAVSRRYFSDFRLPPDIELIGRSHYEIFPDIPPRWREVHARVLAGEELAHEEEPFLRLDGRTDWCRWLMKPWRTAEGRIGGALLFSEVITEQVAGRRALADSEARFRATFENAAVGIAHFDSDFRWLRANEALCRILGYRADELVTKSLEEINHPDDLRTCVAHVERMRDRQIDSFGMDKRYRCKDGSMVWVRLTNGCVRKGDGSIDYFVCMFEDISARKQAEEELQKSEQRFRSSVLHSPLPILLFDDWGEILAVSQSWVEQTGYSREELCRIEEWTHRAYGEHSGGLLEHFSRIISTEPPPHPAEFTIRTKEGRERVWSFVTSALGMQSDGRRLFVSVAQDVTERKAHEEQVRLLMREINHRAKNMLGLVLAIVRQTVAREPEDFIQRSTERIQALAANQDLLVRNEWQGVDMEDLVRAQLALT
jgi:PAS domain S-box-containing protein